MFLPFISDCLTMLWKIWERCPAASLLSARVDGLLQTNEAPVTDLSQPSPDSCWAPCHGCLPCILNSLGRHLVVFGPCDRLRLQHTSQGVVYITQAHLDNLHFFFFYFGEQAKRPKSGSECLEVSIKQFQVYLGWDAKPKSNWRGSCLKIFHDTDAQHWENLSVLMC